MKKTHILYVLVIFFSIPLTVKGMVRQDGHIQLALKTPSLKKHLLHTVTNKVERIIKHSQFLNEPIEKAIEKVYSTLSSLPFGIIDIIRTHLLCRFASKVYMRLGNGIAQYYDGHQETRAQRLDPNNPRKIHYFGSWSTWANLELDQLIKQRKFKLEVQHPVV